MKKLCLLLLVIIIVLNTSFIASAEEKTVKTYGDFEYSVENGEAKIIKYIGSQKQVIIPDTIENCPVTVIGEHAFYKRDWESPSSVTKVVLPPSIREIGCGAFGFCKNLSEINIPDGVESIGDGAFMFCALTKFEFPSKLSVISDSLLEYSKIKTITIPKNIKKLGCRAFEDCKKLKKVVFRCEVTEIPNSLFFGCTKLETVKIPSSVKKVGAYAFSLCKSMKEMVIPDSVEIISPFALDYSGIEKIHLGKQIQSSRSMTCMLKLKKITLSKENKKFAVKNNVLYNKKFTRLYIYPHGNTNKSFKMPSTVKLIRRWAFYTNEHIKEISFSKSLKTIEESAFELCTNLKNVTIPEKVEYIGENAFLGCIKLKTLKINSKKVIGLSEYSFKDCNSLKVADLPEYKKIPDYDENRGLFRECRNLQKAIIKTNVKHIPNYTFYDCPKLKIITVPKSVKEIGKKALGYKYSEKLKKDVKLKGFTIKGGKNTAAHKYAKKNGFKFEVI